MSTSENNNNDKHTQDFLNVFDTEALGIELINSLNFIIEIGKLKSILRQSHLQKQNRRENSAEHSWHLIMMAMTLKNYANQPVDIERVIKMLAIHDLGEIDAGDEFHYSKNTTNNNAEKTCIERLCSMLPPESGKNISSLWNEFEASETPEAQFTQAIDRFQPFLYQLENGGEAWNRHKISYQTALEKNQHIKDGSKKLWEAYQNLAKQAAEQNLFFKKP